MHQFEVGRVGSWQSCCFKVPTPDIHNSKLVKENIEKTNKATQSLFKKLESNDRFYFTVHGTAEFYYHQVMTVGSYISLSFTTTDKAILQMKLKLYLLPFCFGSNSRGLLCVNTADLTPSYRVVSPVGGAVVGSITVQAQ